MYMSVQIATLGISVFLGFLSGALGAYAILKTKILNDKVSEFLEDFTDRLSNDEEYQKRIYTIGGIFAQGAIAGSGLTPKTGKFKFNDLIGQLASQFLGKIFTGNPNQSVPEKPGEWIEPKQKEVIKQW
jgi:hypothetical protein